jgi:hypothetical protein
MGRTSSVPGVHSQTCGCFSQSENMSWVHLLNGSMVKFLMVSHITKASTMFPDPVPVLYVPARHPHPHGAIGLDAAAFPLWMIGQSRTLEGRIPS